MREKNEMWLVMRYQWGNLGSKCGHWTDIYEMALIMLYHCHLEVPSDEQAAACGVIFMSSHPS